VADRERKFVVRFAVGDERGLRSSVWRIWKGRKKDDIYIAPRPMVSVLKGSLHESGLCYFSITTEHHGRMIARGAARERRALARWKRLPTPASGFAGVVSILFASEYLQRNFTPVVEENTTLIDVPKSGETVIVNLIFGRMPGGELLLRPNQRNLGRVMLSSGEEFLIIAGLVKDFDAEGFRQRHQPFSESCEVGFFQEQPHADPDHLRGAILLPAVNDGVLRIVEIGTAYITELEKIDQRKKWSEVPRVCGRC
jgi:hypothetical protein